MYIYTYTSRLAYQYGLLFCGSDKNCQSGSNGAPACGKLADGLEICVAVRAAAPLRQDGSTVIRPASIYFARAGYITPKYGATNPRDWEGGSCPIPRRKPTAGDLNEVKERLKNRKPPRASACFEQGGCRERFRGCGRREVPTAWQRNPLMKTAPGGSSARRCHIQESKVVPERSKD